MTSPNIRDTGLHERYGRLLSYSLPSTGISFAGFLQQADGQERNYWENQNHHTAFAGACTAVYLTAVADDRFKKLSMQVEV